MIFKGFFVSFAFMAIYATPLWAQFNPEITSTPPVEASLGAIYTYDVEATGLPAPTFELEQAPDGMSIDGANGLIEWAPDEVGEFQVTVVATNLTGKDSQEFVVVVTTGNQVEAPSFISTPVTTTFVGQDYAYQVEVAGEPAPELVLLDGPDGMQFDDDANLLTWVSMEVGDYQVSLYASNEGGEATQEFLLSVVTQKTAPIFVSEPVTSATVGEVYSYAPQVTGDPAPEFKLMEAPEGMELDATTGTLTWTPAAVGEYSVSLNAFNEAGEATQDFVISVVAALTAPVITSEARLTVTVDQTYRYTVVATGNPDPTFVLNNAPDGMTINETTGLIRWTPSTPGDYDVSVAAVNAAGSDEQAYTVTVSAAFVAPEITSSPVTSAVVQEVYNYDVEASGNPAPLYALSAAPAGMTIDAGTGVITWTPASAGSFGIIVSVSNDLGQDEQAFTISVSEQTFAPTITSTPVSQTFVNQSYTYQVKANANPAALFSLVEAPEGMSIDEVSGSITWMPTQAGSYDVSVQAVNDEGTDTQAYSLTVSINEVAPTITTSPVTQALAGLAYRYDVDAVGNPEPAFALLESPAGMLVDAESGVIDWTPPTAGSYSVVVEARNTQGSFTQRFTIIVGLQGSVPLVEIQSIQVVSPTVVKLNATVNPNGSPTTVTFEYGQGSVTASKITAIPQNIEGFGEVTVLAELAGLEEAKTYVYRAVAENTVGRIISATRTFTTYRNTYQVAIDQAFPDAVESQSYRLHSIPGDVDLDVAETMTGQLHEDWGAFRDTGAESDYFQSYDGSDAFHFRPGRGFWILSRSNWVVPEQEVTTVALKANGTYQVRLQEGWNIIASPFEVAVPWALVKEATPSVVQTATLWAFNGSFRSAAAMEPYMAYNYFNDAGDGAVLSIPYPGLWQGTSKTAPFKRPGNDGKVSRLVFEATDRRSLQSRAELRIDAYAREEKDPLDQYAPRDNFSSLSARFVPPFESPYGLLAVDARPSVEGGAAFELAVRAAAGERLDLEVAGLEDFIDANVMLVDLLTGQHIDLHETPAISIHTQSVETRYQVLIGPDAYIEEMSEVVTPDALLLHQNYPNPFAGSTTITYSLPAADTVVLAVYDMLGREVRTLVDGMQGAGFHEVAWDGRNDAGVPMANGTYLMRIRASDGATQTVSVTRVR